MELQINKDTVLCMSLAARPGNFGTRFQNYLFSKLKLNFVYKAFTTNDLRAAIGGIRALGVRGCAISMPYKEACMEFLDDMDNSARGIESVNTVVNTGGRLKGFNTDYTAVRQILQLNSIPTTATFALFGSGGMAKAAICALRDLGFTKGTVVARNEGTGRALAARYGFGWTPELRDKPDLLINASPLGMAGGQDVQRSPFSEEVVSACKYVMDVVAIPEETKLLALAKQKSKVVMTGVDVTMIQALEQFVLYTGVQPDLALVREAAAFARSN
jgi:shikimate dehydrogenase